VQRLPGEGEIKPRTGVSLSGERFRKNAKETVRKIPNTRKLSEEKKGRSSTYQGKDWFVPHTPDKGEADTTSRDKEAVLGSAGETSPKIKGTGLVQKKRNKIGRQVWESSAKGPRRDTKRQGITGVVRELFSHLKKRERPSISQSKKTPRRRTRFE